MEQHTQRDKNNKVMNKHRERDKTMMLMAKMAKGTHPIWSTEWKRELLDKTQPWSHGGSG